MIEFDNLISKLEENGMINKQQPLSNFTMNNLIYEDNENKKLTIYDSSLFENMECFKIANKENSEIDSEFNAQEKKKKLEKEILNFQTYISKYKNYLTDMESHTNKIILEMELDQKKREEMEKKEIERLERIRKIREEEERIKKEEEAKRRADEIKKINEERIRIQKEKEKNKINGLEEFNKGGRNIKERLINAGKNYVNIKKEVEKIINYSSAKTIKINKAVNDIITLKATSYKFIEREAIHDLKKLFNEIKEGENKELYLYACFCILSIIFNKLKELDLEMNYDNIIINAQIIKSLDCTTLIYMFFQRVSNKCPYIIPLPYVKVEHDKIFKEAEINQVFKLTRDAEYIYFTFLYLDINKYISIVENYIINIEGFKPEHINFLISSSFLCFIDVFGNYIIDNKREWMNKIYKIKENVVKGLKIEEMKCKKSTNELSSINKSIYIKLENCFEKLNSKGYTYFKEKYNELTN